MKLRGLPYGATILDVAAFFRGFGAQEHSIHLGINGDGRPSGEVCVGAWCGWVVWVGGWCGWGGVGKWCGSVSRV